MSLPPPDGPRRYRGLLGRCSIIVPAIVFGAWRVAGAQDGPHGGEMAPFLLAMASILVAAKLGGELVERLNQPAVLGELLVGIVLGNVGLTGIEVFEGLKTEPFLPMLAEIGVILLLFQVGLESDLDGLLAVGTSAVGVAVLGIVVPMALGYAVSSVFLPGDAAWYVHLFLGATLAATSVGITARVLRDLGRMEAPESKIILGAAVVDDILGLIVLATVLGLVRSADTVGALGISVVPVLLIVAKAFGFLAGALLFGRVVIIPLMRIFRMVRSPSAPVVLSVAYCFLLAALADLVGLADIVGAFAAGLVVKDDIARVFGRHKDPYKIDEAIAPIGTIFVPVFFVYMGLRVDLLSFASLDVLIFAGLLTVVAAASKQACVLGVRERGLNRWAVGIGMIPRGEVGLIFASIGQTVVVAGAPVLSGETFSAIIAMVMLTTLMTPPLLKVVFVKPPNGPAPTGPDAPAGT